MSAGEPKSADKPAADDEPPTRSATTDPAPPIAPAASGAKPAASSIADAAAAAAGKSSTEKPTPGTAAEKPAEKPAADATTTAPETPASKDAAETPAVASTAESAAAKTDAGAPGTTADALEAAPAASAKSPDEDKPGIHVHLYGQTDVGLVREHNEDNFLLVDLTTSVRGVDERLLRHTIGPRGSLLVVCDGMGGAAAGEIASQMAVDTLHDIMTTGGPPENRDHFARRLVHAVEEAGSRIFSSAKMDRTRRGMGTTSTVAGVVDKILFVGQVGDSRAYALRGGKDFALITKDQSLVNQLIEAGQLTEEEAEAFEHSNIILQALGTAEQVTVDLTFLELKRGDRVMLCSDGLSGLVHGEMIKDVLATVADPRACCATLIEMARAGGGHDNITVIVADFHGADLALPDDGSRPAYQQYPLPESFDPRTSFPPRETGMKSGGPKPGSDVKSDPYGRRHAGSGAEREGSNLLMWIGVVLVLAVVAAIGYAMFGGGAGAVDSSGDTPDSLQPVTTPAAPATPVEVRVVSDVRQGELWVDGERRMALNPSGRTVVELPPGAYSLEARTLAGATAATASLTVVAGTPMDFTLSMPTGSADEGPVTIGEPIGGRPDGGVTASDGAVVTAPDVEPPTATAEPMEAPDAGRPRARRPDGGASGRGGATGARPPGPLPENPFGN